MYNRIIEYLLKVRIISRVSLVPHLSALKVVEKEEKWQDFLLLLWQCIDQDFRISAPHL